MLSQIERSQANPTVAVVWRLANALGVPLTDLLAGAPRAEPPAIVTVTAGDTPALGAALTPAAACASSVRSSSPASSSGTS